MCMRVCVGVRTCANVCVRVHVRMCACVHVCVCAYERENVCVHAHMCTHLYKCAPISVEVDIQYQYRVAKTHRMP